MNRRRRPPAGPLALAAFAVLSLACGGELAAPGGPVGPITPPEAPTTGNKWVAEESVNADGSRCFVLQDEECGGTSADGYLDYFESSIFRTAHVQAEHLYAVDGSNIWILDVRTPTRPERVGLVTGVGRALALTGRDGLLYVAAGERGVGVFAVDPAQPSRLERRGELALGGPALDVALRPDGKVLYAAVGGAGLAAIALDEEGLPQQATLVPVPGFASGVTAKGLQVFVAGCSGLTVVSSATLTVLGTVAIAPASGQAPLPVKDVVVEDGIAAVAAGRWGVYFVDVSNPLEMVVLGNHTVSDDLLYYGNGVAFSHGHFYLAAGDWGVDRVSLESVREGGVGTTLPEKFPRYCTSAEHPDRKPAPRLQTVLPAPRSQDPLDVIVVGDALFAAGDASRLGLRAIDVYDLSPEGAHAYSGRYEEPRRVRGIAAGADKVVVAGAGGGVYSPVASSGLLSFQAALPEGHDQARAVAVCGDGRVASLDERGALLLEGAGVVTEQRLAPALAADGEYLVGVKEEGGVEIFRLVSGGAEYRRSVTTGPFTHGAAHAFAGDRFFIASAAWERARSIDLTSADAPSVDLSSPALTRQELEDATGWRNGPPTRVLVPFGDSLAEVASFGGRARAVLHPLSTEGVTRTFHLPPGTYVAGTSEGSRLILVQGDRARYRTAVVEVDFADAQAEPSVRMQVFLGSAVGAARVEDVLYVADHEAGVRAFRIGESGVTSLGVADLETGR
jgi:hypothetical protein